MCRYVGTYSLSTFPVNVFLTRSKNPLAESAVEFSLSLMLSAESGTGLPEMAPAIASKTSPSKMTLGRVINFEILEQDMFCNFL